MKFTFTVDTCSIDDFLPPPGPEREKFEAELQVALRQSLEETIRQMAETQPMKNDAYNVDKFAECLAAMIGYKGDMFFDHTPDPRNYHYIPVSVVDVDDDEVMP